ncbi:MAG: outer membrane beta-barrel protein [Cyclobacteriaceae bacterium]
MKGLILLCYLLSLQIPIVFAQSTHLDVDSIPKEKLSFSKWYLGLHIDQLRTSKYHSGFRARGKFLVGYQFHPQIALQSGLSYSNQDRFVGVSGGPARIETQHTFGIPIGLRFDLRGPDKKWTPYFLTGISTQWGTFKDLEYQNQHDFSTDAFLELGIRYKPTPNLGINISGGWGDNFGFTGGVGIIYKFGKVEKSRKIKNKDPAQ